MGWWVPKKVGAKTCADHAVEHQDRSAYEHGLVTNSQDIYGTTVAEGPTGSQRIRADRLAHRSQAAVVLVCEAVFAGRKAIIDELIKAGGLIKKLLVTQGSGLWGSGWAVPVVWSWLCGSDW